jgi:hypothetical protein
MGFGMWRKVSSVCGPLDDATKSEGRKLCQPRRTPNTYFTCLQRHYVVSHHHSQLGRHPYFQWPSRLSPCNQTTTSTCIWCQTISGASAPAASNGLQRPPLVCKCLLMVFKFERHDKCHVTKVCCLCRPSKTYQLTVQKPNLNVGRDGEFALILGFKLP